MVVIHPYNHDPGGYRELKALEAVVKRRTQGISRSVFLDKGVEMTGF